MRVAFKVFLAVMLLVALGLSFRAVYLQGRVDGLSWAMELDKLDGLR